MIREENDFINLVRSYKLVETICKLKNIPLIWHHTTSNYRMFDLETIKLHNLKKDSHKLASILENYFDITKTIMDEIPSDIKYFPSARDNMHAGYRAQQLICERIYNLLQTEKII